MNKTTLAGLFSALSLVGLFVVSCGTPARHFANGSGGDGDVATSGGTSTVGDGGTGAGGTLPSAGAGAVSAAGDDAGGSSGAGGSGASSGGQGMPECTATQKLCGGVCVDINDPTYGCDPTLCTTTGCPDAPGATLQCDAGQCLLGSCGAGTKKCDGRCVSLTDPAYGCGAATCDASTCPSQGTGGILVCTDSACVIGTCPTGYKKCGNKCVAISDPTYGCGATSCDASSCPPAGTGTLVCQNSACVIGTCGAGTKKCGSNCVTTDANNGCADATRCTACANNEACSGTPTTCKCVPTPMATVCAGKCGSVSNGCGGMYTCGTCTSPQSCGGAGTPNVCGCTPTPMATACSGKNCGSVSNGCTGSYTCGTCGGSTPNCVSNKCVCTPTPMSTACSGKSCGTVSDGCTGSYTCGTCSSSAPACVNSTCKQCSTVADCPSGTFNCTNNACVCRTPSSANVIKDGGFDNQSALNSWTSSGTVWTKSDADSCPESGSITMTGTISRCFQIPQAPLGAQYSFGIQYKAGAGQDSGCTGATLQDSNCTQNGSLWMLLAANESSSWTSTVFAEEVPEGTSSIQVQCSSSSFLTIDQMYLRVSGPSGF